MDLWENSHFHILPVLGFSTPPQNPLDSFHTFFPPPDVVMSLNFRSSRAQFVFSHPLALAQMLTPSTRFCFMTGCVLPGRPFAIELVNPHRVHFTSQEIKELQQVNHFMTWKSSCFCISVIELELLIVFLFLLLQKINNSSNKIQVRDLQLVTR